MPIETKIGKTVLRLVTGDIADQETDAVVTAAHWRLNKGAGTDGTIHTKGGPQIYDECRKLGSCPIGDAVITTGGMLKARHVIHAVGPVWRGGEEGEAFRLPYKKICTAFRFHPFRPVHSYIHLCSRHQLPSKQSLNFSDRVNTTWMKSESFSIRARMNGLIRCSRLRLIVFSPTDLTQSEQMKVNCRVLTGN
jgi:hypothetical protein